MKHTRQDLKIMQGWSLERKIRVTQTRIMEWYMRYDGQVFISFSGGKDSTVLLDLARRVYPDIPAVYVDTGLEYPELRDFVKTKDNVIWLRPRYPFTQILEKYGYPIISKEVSDVINGARKGQPYRLARLNGELLDKNGKKSIYNCENYKYLLDAPFKISARCCYHMKKAPLNKFERQSGRHPINVKRTQYLNLLSWCWEEMSRDRNERCLLVCDEAYLMIDPQVPQSLVFLRNVEKRARKYEAGLAIISHSVVDFLAPEVKMYGQALLDIPCYKILMGCDGKNLQETKDLYNLTDAEQELLESKRRGHALFIIGSKRLHVNFEIPAYKFSYMGKAGGR